MIKGPCYIGRGSIIGNGALIRDFAHLGKRCVVGFGTEIKHSYIGNDCWFHMNYIGDSVVGSRCSFGAGTVTANLRFDEGEVMVKVADERRVRSGKARSFHWGGLSDRYQCKPHAWDKGRTQGSGRFSRLSF